jgi:hypothetical protein
MPPADRCLAAAGSGPSRKLFADGPERTGQTQTFGLFALPQQFDSAGQNSPLDSLGGCPVKPIGDGGWTNAELFGQREGSAAESAKDFSRLLPRDRGRLFFTNFHQLELYGS